MARFHAFEASGGRRASGFPRNGLSIFLLVKRAIKEAYAFALAW